MNKREGSYIQEMQTFVDFFFFKIILDIHSIRFISLVWPGKWFLYSIQVTGEEKCENNVHFSK